MTRRHRLISQVVNDVGRIQIIDSQSGRSAADGAIGISDQNRIIAGIIGREAVDYIRCIGRAGNQAGWARPLIGQRRSATSGYRKACGIASAAGLIRRRHLNGRRVIGCQQPFIEKIHGIFAQINGAGSAIQGPGAAFAGVINTERVCSSRNAGKEIINVVAA